MAAVINAAVPIFGLILVGFVCAKFGVFDRTATDNLNRFSIYLALPALMFLAMAKIAPDQLRQVGFLGAFAGGTAFTYSLGYAFALWRGRSRAVASIEGLDAGYSNVGFMGIPLCLLALGPDSLPIAIIATLFTGCILFLLALVLVEINVGEAVGRRAACVRIVRSLLRNPLLLAPAAGLCVSLLGLPVPAPIDRFAGLLGAAASPCALVCIGLFLAQEPILPDDMKPILVLTALKLLVQPGITAALAFRVLDMPPLWSHAAVLLSALPVGSGPFTIAKLYKLEAGVTSGTILLSHVLSVATVSVLLAWLV